MANDFITPDQYKRGVGKIKEYVDDRSINSFPVCKKEYIGYGSYSYYVNIHDLVVGKRYSEDEETYGGIVFTDGTLDSDGNLKRLDIKNDKGNYGILTKTYETLSDLYIDYGNNFYVYDKEKKSLVDARYSTILRTDNITEYIPTKDYNPVTKKYVDELVNANKTIICTDDEVNDMLNEVLGGDYSGN